MRWRENKTSQTDPELRRLMQDVAAKAPEDRLDVTAGGADAAFTVDHHLGRIPTGVIQHVGTMAGTIYATTADRAAWTAKQLTLRCDAAGWAGKIDVY